MFETSDSEINVDRLMQEIRETVARQKQGAGEGAPAPLSRLQQSDKSGLHALIDSSPLSLQPEFQPRQDNQYHINDLLKYHGRDFVRNAYRAILKREPDEAGLTHHLENLASGRFNKVDVLASLRFSPEGERARVRIDGLAWPATVRRMGRAPVIGYLFQIATAVGRLPFLLQHQRRSEFYLLSQLQQIVDHHDQFHQQFAQAVARRDAESAAYQQQLIESLLQQQQAVAARQVEFRDAVETRLTAIRQHADQSAAALAQKVEESAASLTRQVSQSTEAMIREVEDQIQQLLHRQQETRTELLMQQRRLTLLLEKARAQQPGDLSQPFVQQLAEEEDHLLDALYASFEDQFRGDREEVKNRLQVYLPILKEAGVFEGVLDIGCGRGEWLEILKGEGVRGRGVDRNRVFVEQCRQLGLEVVEEDALVYLRSLPDHSLNAVTSFHLVEHLPFEILIKLLDEIVRTLRPGGLLILETPNPENFIVGSCSFYADPTHRHPIPSATLQFLLEARGLSGIKIMRLRSWDAAKIEGDAEIIKRFNEYFYSAPDYAVVGWKG